MWVLRGSSVVESRSRERVKGDAAVGDVGEGNSDGLAAKTEFRSAPPRTSFRDSIITLSRNGAGRMKWKDSCRSELLN